FGAGHVGFAVALGLLVTDLPELGTGSIAVDDGGDGRKQVCTRRLGGDNGVFRNEVDQGFPPSWVVIADDDVGPVARGSLAIRWREGDVQPCLTHVDTDNGVHCARSLRTPHSSSSLPCMTALLRPVAGAGTVGTWVRRGGRVVLAYGRTLGASIGKHMPC